MGQPGLAVGHGVCGAPAAAKQGAGAEAAAAGVAADVELQLPPPLLPQQPCTSGRCIDCSY